VQRRYIFMAAWITLQTPAGPSREPLWMGIEVDEGTLNLERLSKCGYDLVPAEGFTTDELRSVGVTTFHRLELPVDTE
jgi:hypothetical protein